MNRDELKAESFFSLSSFGVSLSEYGVSGTQKILDEYSDGQIREISGVSRSALRNYINDVNKISKRGQEAIKKLVIHYNGNEADINSSTLEGLKSFSDRELLAELKRRKFQVFVSV